MNDNGTMATGDAGRRALLKKLGLAAGAVAWATPAVQTIATAVAGAQDKTGGSGCYDISHLDLIVMRDGQGPYGIQWDPGSGWSKHSTSSKHCLSGYTWTQPPSSVLSGLPTPVAKAGGSYELTLPAGVAIVQSGGGLLAWSKTGTKCQRVTLVSGTTYRFDKWCWGTTTTTTAPTTTTTSTTTSTTTTTRPTTTSAPTTTTTVKGDDCDDDDKGAPQSHQVNYGSTQTTRRGGATSTSSAQPKTATTTTRPSGGGSGDDCGSPGPGKDISHMDWILSRPGTARYGIQYDFGSGWGAHPSNNTSSKHCLAGLSWRVPPGTWSYAGFGNAVSLGGGAFRITLPANVTVHDAFSKCGQTCRRATHLGGNTWRFDPC